MDSTCNCKDILNWTNSKLTIIVLILANLLYFIVRKWDISFIALLCQLLFYYIIGKIICKKLDVKICNKTSESKCEEILTNYISEINEKLNKITNLEDIPNLINICILCLLVINFLEKLQSITILILFFDVYVLLNNPTIKKLKDKYLKMVNDLVSKNLLDKIPKYEGSESTSSSSGGRNRSNTRSKREETKKEDEDDDDDENLDGETKTEKY